MQKKLFALILVLVLLLLLPACASSSLRTAEEVAALEKQVAEEIREERGYPYEMKLDLFGYYGTENGYHIIFYHSAYDNICTSWTREIAGYSFDGGGNAQFVAYRKGEFIDLRDAYASGLISKEAIAKAAELHAANKNATDE